MQLAEREAKRLNHEYIGTEHILLGLLADTPGGRRVEVIQQSRGHTLSKGTVAGRQLHFPEGQKAWRPAAESLGSTNHFVLA